MTRVATKISLRTELRTGTRTALAAIQLNHYSVTTMENAAAKIRVSLREGLLEIEGSEEFVSKQIENLKDVITKLPTVTPPPIPAAPAQPQQANGQTASATTAITSLDASKYVNIISVDGGMVKILKDIPGKSVPEKTANAALLYLLGKSFLGSEEATANEIRETCKAHGFLNEANFATYLKAPKEWINLLGSGKNAPVKLTFPGKKAALALADSLNVTE